MEGSGKAESRSFCPMQLECTTLLAHDMSTNPKAL